MDWHPRYHRLALEGMRHLTLEQRGAYQTCLDLMYERDGPIPDDDRWLSGHMGCSVRAWKVIRAALVDDGKLVPSGEGKSAVLINPKVAEELAIQNSRRKTNAENGARGGKTSVEKKTKPSEINDNGEATAKASLKLKTKTETETETETEEDSSFQSESAREDDFGDMFGGSLPVPAKPKREKRTPTHLPKDWQPSDEDREFAGSEGMTEAQTDREAQRFKDHWKTTAKNATKADWPATWRNWIRRITDDPRWKSANGQSEPAWKSERAQSFEDIQAAAIEAAHQRSSGG